MHFAIAGFTRSVPIVAVSIIIARIIAIVIVIVIVGSMRMMLSLSVSEFLSRWSTITYGTMFPVGALVMIVVLGGLALGREGWGELGAARKRAGRDGQRR